MMLCWCCLGAGFLPRVELSADAGPPECPVCEGRKQVEPPDWKSLPASSKTHAFWQHNVDGESTTVCAQTAPTDQLGEPTGDKCMDCMLTVGAALAETTADQTWRT